MSFSLLFFKSAFCVLSFLLINVFVEHFRDVSEEDLRLWLPQPEKSIEELDENTNHEDRLPIKNLIYHAMKNSIAVLARSQGITFADILKDYESFTDSCSDSTK